MNLLTRLFNEALKKEKEIDLCYFTQETVRDTQGGYKICVAHRDVRGYSLTDVSFRDRKTAQNWCNDTNEKLGIDKIEAIKIVCSSMKPKKS